MLPFAEQSNVFNTAALGHFKFLVQNTNPIWVQFSLMGLKAPPTDTAQIE